jgi:hypothetical protein
MNMKWFSDFVVVQVVVLHGCCDVNLRVKDIPTWNARSYRNSTSSVAAHIGKQASFFDEKRRGYVPLLRLC